MEEIYDVSKRSEKQIDRERSLFLEPPRRQELTRRAECTDETPREAVASVMPAISSTTQPLLQQVFNVLAINIIYFILFLVLIVPL